MTVPTVVKDAAEVVNRIPLTAVTVVLLTALWSSETNEVRVALQKASELVDCASVSYYELDVQIKEVHRAVPQLEPYVLSNLWQRAATPPKKRDNSMAVFNVTRSIPYFPCIRLFMNSTATAHTFEDDMSAVALARRIEFECGKVSGVSGGESQMGRMTRYVTPISKDEFAQHMHGRNHATMGALYFDSGGIAGDLSKWDVLAQAVSNRGGGWVVSIVDAEKDVEVGRRNGARGGDVALVHFVKGSRQTFSMRVADDVAAVERVLERFESGLEGDKSASGGVRRSRILLAPFRRASIGSGAQQLGGMCYMGLGDALDGGEGKEAEAASVVWIVVYQRWCAFCQRVMPVYQGAEARLRRMNVDAHVLLVEQVSELPIGIDALVDGFPTVIRAVVWRAQWHAHEYIGQHSIAQIIEMSTGMK